MTIVMTGATGKLGGLILRQLSYRCRTEEIIASSRRPQDAELGGVEVRYGDYDEPDSLAASFRGASKLMMVSSPVMDETVRLRQHAAVIEAAREAGVSHIAYTSIFAPEKGRLPLHKLHLATEQAIKESGIAYTLLRNGYYMDIAKMLGVREAAAGGVLVSPPGSWRFNTVSREDLALAAATVLTESGHENRTTSSFRPGRGIWTIWPEPSRKRRAAESFTARIRRTGIPSTRCCRTPIWVSCRKTWSRSSGGRFARSRTKCGTCSGKVTPPPRR